MTAAQAALIEAIHQTLEADERVEAAWLSGSFGNGTADDFSDVDVLVLVKQPWQDAAGAYATDLGAIAETVLVSPLFDGRIVNVVTADWDRFDLSFVTAEELSRYDQAGLKALFNKTGAEPPTRAHGPYQPPPEKIADMIREFLRILGLAHVIHGREEYVKAVAGVELLRAAVIELMIEDRRIAPQDRGGALHLRRLVTTEQYERLSRFPAMTADRASIVDGSVAAAELFLPLARKLAAETGAHWPQALEDATRRKLAPLGISF